MTKQVYFKVDGQWFTDFIRNLYYAEDKTYEECKNKLCKSLCLNNLTEEQNEELAQSIIFGEKKLIGINNLELVDDLEFDVYSYSRISRPRNFEIGKGVTGILTTDGVFAECEYGGHYGVINFVDNDNQKCAGALVFSTGVPGDNETAYVQRDEISPLSKYQIRWYMANKKYLNKRQIRHIERYLRCS